MTPENWHRLKPLFGKALELEEEERARFLEQLSAQDVELGAELKALLRAHEQRTWSLDRPIFEAHQATETPGQFVPGEIVLGRFRIDRLIGTGGMGEVYQAFDLELGPVALKTIRPDIVNNPAALTRFRREVQLARRIVSPYVCRIHEFFLLPDNSGGALSSGFFTMELLDGMTLADRIKEDGPLPWRGGEALALHLCEGLQAIHDAGVIHRDLKCRNIMLAVRNGGVQPVTMDFGLAREASATSDFRSSDSTVRQILVGTPEYMAPEQFECATVGPATDIYALGIILYETITGIHPFSSASMLGTAVRRAKRPIPASSIQKGLPQRWDHVIYKCLEYEPQNRFQSAAEVAEALCTRPVSVSNLKQKAKVAHAHPLISFSVFLFLAVALALAFLWLHLNAYRPPSPDVESWYERGVGALREGTYLKAVHALKQAIAKDDDFALAHARLAEAYNELDYYGQAKDELLEASRPEVAHSLPALDRLYLEAIRATVLHDFTSAVRDYRTILRRLPQSERAYGYVDLGRAYEKLGDLPRAIDSYAAAAKLAPQDPAAFIHVGILEGRQNHRTAADVSFAKAEALYEGLSNYEGAAEIDYERGEMAFSNADLNGARAYLMRALTFAQDRSAPLAARVLCKLSAEEHAARNDKNAELWAEKALTVAHSEGLAYWESEVDCRLAMAYTYPWTDAQGHSYSRLGDADRAAQSALQSAERNRWPLIAADAQFTLALIRNRQDCPKQAVSFAESALDYYRQAGYFTESTKALILLIRARRHEANFQDALKLCRQGLDLEERSGSPPVMIQMEEAVGTVYSALEQFPEALNHFQIAEGIARRNGSDLLGYEVVFTAEALAQLGRYKDAEAALYDLNSASARDPYLTSSIDSVMAEMRLSQGRYKEAFDAASRARHLDPSSPLDLDTMALADLYLGSKQKARALASQALSAAQNTSDQVLIARTQLAYASICFKTSSIEQAKTLAESAQVTFAKLSQPESEWRTLALLAQAAAAEGDLKSTKKFSSKSLDILLGLEHNWGTSFYGTYLSRPDVKIEIRKTRVLVERHAREEL